MYGITNRKNSFSYKRRFLEEVKEPELIQKRKIKLTFGFKTSLIFYLYHILLVSKCICLDLEQLMLKALGLLEKRLIDRVVELRVLCPETQKLSQLS